MNMAVLSRSQEGALWPASQKCALASEDIQGIRELLPPGVTFLAAPVDNWIANIDPREQEIVQHAVFSRQSEFSTGRMLAAQAFIEMGIPVSPVLRGPMNEPIWPAGIVGSISHSSNVCLVAVAPKKQIAGLGIDFEANRPEFVSLSHLIIRPDERQANNDQALSQRDAVRLFFGAKESLYKAIHSDARRFVDFQEVRLEIGFEAGEFTASAPEDMELDALVTTGTGRFLFAEECLFTVWYRKP